MDKKGKDDPKRQFGGVVTLIARAIAFFRRFRRGFYRKDRRSRARRLAAYAVAGVLVFAALMTVVLASGKDEQGPQTEQAAASAGTAATPIPTTHAEPIPTTQPDMGTPVPTEEPTPEPTQKPVQTPKPTQKPEATPKPTKTPKPKATAQPTAAPTPAEEVVDNGTRPANLDACVAAFAVQSDAYFNDRFSSNTCSYTEEEKYMLAQIIEIEARGQPTDGLIAVGNVVLNRVLCPKFESTIKAVITSSAFPYEKNKDRVPSTASVNAASAVLDKEVWVVPQNVYFFNSSLPAGENWGRNVFYAKIGSHCFYSYDYSGRSNSGAVPPPLFDRVYQYAQYGCKNQERVKRIQFMLGALGYGVSADGVFGKGTADALKQFQSSAGLSADGVAGPGTVKALVSAYGFDNYCAKYYG